MAVIGPVLNHEDLLRELRLVREHGLRALRRLDLPALHQAAAAADVTTTDAQPQPAAVEELIRRAVDRFDGGAYQEAAEYTFGLIGGTKFQIAAERRRQAAKACHVSSETFRKSHEKIILEQTAEAILALVHQSAMRHVPLATMPSISVQRASSEADSQDDVREVPSASSEGAARQKTTPIANIERAAPPTAPRSRPRRRSRALSGLVAIVLILELFAGAFVLTRHPAAEQAWNGMTAAELERRYDGKLPWGDDDNSRCSDQPGKPRSETLDPKNTPPVMVPDARVVGTLQLRKSPICPTAVWARILWNGDEQKKYQLPAGWTLHSVMHRPVTNTVIDERDHSYASEAPYIVSRMISSARGCVYAEAYFTRDDQPDVKTAIARTSCDQA